MRLIQGDCLEVMRTLADNSVDAVVTDPPYHLTNNTGTRSLYPGQYTPVGEPSKPKGGFMGKQWDGGDIAQNPALWSEVLRVLKPGGHLAAFSGTRTYHRMACAIEDSGFEVRDQLAWTYGQGFPKSLDVGKSIDAMKGWGTALKPAWEPICLARKPLSEKTVAANVLRWGTGAINVDGCRVGGEAIEIHRRTTNVTRANSMVGVSTGSTGTGEFREGRFPANLCHDNSNEVLAAFPESNARGGGEKTRSDSSGFGTFEHAGGQPKAVRNDTGSAARFFYSAKASKADRALSKHPTVKPVKLMQWLCRLITPPGGVILDPFAGSGTTGAAAILEGFRPILIEREDEYVADIRRRMGEPAVAAAYHGDA